MPNRVTAEAASSAAPDRAEARRLRRSSRPTPDALASALPAKTNGSSGWASCQTRPARAGDPPGDRPPARPGSRHGGAPPRLVGDGGRRRCRVVPLRERWVGPRPAATLQVAPLTPCGSRPRLVTIIARDVRKPAIGSFGGPL